MCHNLITYSSFITIMLPYVYNFIFIILFYCISIVITEVPEAVQGTVHDLPTPL